MAMFQGFRLTANQMLARSSRGRILNSKLCTVSKLRFECCREMCDKPTEISDETQKNGKVLKKLANNEGRFRVNKNESAARMKIEPSLVNAQRSDFYVEAPELASGRKVKKDRIKRRGPRVLTTSGLTPAV